MKTIARTMTRAFDGLARNWIRVFSIGMSIILIYEGLHFIDSVIGRAVVWTLSLAFSMTGILWQSNIKDALGENEER